MGENDHAERLAAQLEMAEDEDDDGEVTPDQVLVDDLVDVCLDADATDDAVVSATLEEVNAQLNLYRSGLSVEKALRRCDSGDDLPEVNADEPAKVRIHGSDESVVFDIGSSFTEDEILYLKFTDEERLRQLRDFANAHLKVSDDGGDE
ncbi:hypothetical protein [Halorubrum tebenquichense]|uniref:Uncharacterized protein n=1 Tax=Halorubrum tebenquichense DSM 14210 TaxID=1227485 RepID=M0DU32_9EURY|nr:hypothetical protein [Halorubrum tebenquichense]ELZ38995.1 hypothetical protein C472_05621 [Halorubrum tebenquichense DSM 14210]